ncbi:MULTISPECIES: ParB/RepB/Spo0J family partition protein [Ruminococcus]|jgi:ParB family chromosome partitioning protein|uniref:ParB/RepB/Spo0J family partition protein n=1 Tax=Ruminococcus TaxID=1263 RepID=UPI0004673127|nr:MULTISPECIES: ParB/RepB/Spo0J family partition protein [Ruminococcus]MCR5021813.1 ParB/RepB/Spo0J family partition protein [Ruminococcus sp.]
MAKIDFKAMKNAQKAVEDKVEDNIPEGLEKSYTDLWSGGKETVIQVDISRLVPYSDENGNEQPFKINQKRVEQIAESAKDIGIVSPLTVISKGDIYQIISGHHRLEAAKLIGQLKVPCIVKNYTEDIVYKAVSESNIQRDKTYPSEYAKIFSKYFKMRDDEDLTAEEIAKKFGVSRKTIYRYINVEKLIPELQYLVDDEIIKFNAVEYIKGFSEDIQRELYNVLSENKLSLTRVTAIKLRDYINELADEITADEILEMLTVPDKPKSKGPYKNKVYCSISEKYGIKMTENELDELTEKLLEQYFSKKKKK